MPPPLLLRGARQLLTLRDLTASPPGPRRGARLAELGVVNDGAVLISNGVIQAVGPTRRVENLAEAKSAIPIDAMGKIVMPAFINCDCSLLSSQLTINSTTRTAKSLTQMLLRSALQTMQCGTGGMESRIQGGPDEQWETKALRANRELQLRNRHVLSTYVPGKASIDKLSRMLPIAVQRNLAQCIEITIGAEGHSPKEAKYIAEYATGLGLLVMARISAGLTNCTGIPFRQIRWDGRANEQEIAWAAEKAPILTAAPLRLMGHPTGESSQWRKMIDAGAAVALATGGDGSFVGTQNMQLVLSMACMQLGLSVAEAIVATTINGAYALGFEKTAGSIEHGKRGDLLILDVPDYHEIPYHLGINLVSKVILQGRIVYKQSELEWLGA